MFWSCPRYLCLGLWGGPSPTGLSGDKDCRVNSSNYLAVQLHLSEKKQAQAAQGHTTVEGKIWIPTQSLDEAAPGVKAEPVFAAL